jgi:excinuclease UvrABC nuclease subunit
MVSHIIGLEFFVTANEDDALFLEAFLINKHKPHYNILLKDDKRFPYIRITDKIEIARKREKDAVGGEYFGPYFNGIRAGVLLDIIRTVHGNAPERARSFLRGELNGETRAVLEKRMTAAAEMQQFELAIAYRNALRMLSRLTKKITATAEDADAFSLGACRELGEILGLLQTPRRIECYDISHTAGENTVGSMVVFTDGIADKGQYRKFKIRHGMGNNDFLSLNEVLTRRLKHREWDMPAVIVIDGGKGQLSATAPVIAPYGITAISLAKQFELVYTTKSDEPVVLPKHSYALRLLQRMRDEAHRFAITYHRGLRGKKMIC